MLEIFFMALSLWLFPAAPAMQLVKSPHPSFPYLLGQPDQVFKMPAQLKEISGLSLTADGKQIAANNDERGMVFLLNKETGSIEQEIDFGEDGDYEGIEIVGLDAYVVKSSGTIYQVKNYASPNRETKKSRSFLNKENDVEGLAYHAPSHSLLVGCKGKATDEDDMAPQKAVYCFDINTGEVDAVPAFLLTLQNVQHFLEHYPADEAQDKLLEIFSPDTKEMKFSPSAIAIHPLTGDVYITSSTGKMLLVFSPGGEILFLEKLKKSIHPQPEGICFDQDGTLYIANEGQDGPGKIYKFSYRN